MDAHLLCAPFEFFPAVSLVHQEHFPVLEGNLECKHPQVRLCLCPSPLRSCHRNHPYTYRLQKLRPIWLSHLIVDSFQDWCHFVTNSANHKENISLTRRKSWKTSSKAVDVVVGTSCGHIFHSTARCNKRVLKNREFSGPSKSLFKTASQKQFIL